MSRDTTRRAVRWLAALLAALAIGASAGCHKPPSAETRSFYMGRSDDASAAQLGCYQSDKSGRMTLFFGAPTKVRGELTLHGVTRPVELRIERFKCMPHPMNQRDWCGADATATFRRDEFGIDAGKDYGFDMNATLRIQVEAVRKQ